MCGIAGIISLNGSPLPNENIMNMCDEIKHRGPDGEGFLITNADTLSNRIRSERPGAVLIPMKHDQNIVLGHRRLSIVDLNASAAQPMTDFTGRYWIVYNGEIYNHAALRKDLEQKGYIFKTDHSDTEVILNAYDYWGVECLKQFNGMWSFCIWDSKSNSIFMARDLVGKKPLYYIEHENVLYFASELKALLANKHIPRELDKRALYDYLTYLAVPAPGTVFVNIKKLPAGHYLFFTPGGPLNLKQYWSPMREYDFFEANEKELTEQLREKMNNSIKLRFRADVEVGLLLSGGLDSSINMACLSQQTSRAVKAFSVGFENRGDYTNEFEYAEKVAKQFGADYHQLVLKDEEFINFFPDMVYYQDEPIGDPANIPIYYISKIAREKNVKVLLGGEGSDELFIGYELWSIARNFENTLQGKANLSKVINFLHKNSPARNRRPYYYSWYKKIENNQPVFWSGTELRSEEEKRNILSPEFLEGIGNYNSFIPLSKTYSTYQRKENLDSYDWMTSSDLLYRLPDMLLARLDRMTMAASVEGRNPFLDTNMIEFAMRIPPSLKNKNGQDKYILKKAYEGILPDEIIYRKKDSFSVPLDRLFSNKKYRSECLQAIEEFSDDIHMFSKPYMDALKKSGSSKDLWNISNLAMWYRKFK